MKGKNRLFLFLSFVALMAIYGCVGPGQESFDLGKQMTGQDRLEEAIVNYEKAVAQEPDNPEYKQALGQAKGMLSGKLKEKVKSILSQPSLSTDQLKTAFETAEKARKLIPNDQETARLLERVKAEMESSDKKAKRLADEAVKDLENNQWAAGVRKMREIKKLFPNDQNLSSKLTKIENQGLAYYQKEAQKDRASDDWGEVIKALTSAQEIAPTNSEVIKGLKEAKEKHTPEYYFSRAESMGKQGNWERVIVYTKKASLADTSGAYRERIKDLNLNTAGYFIGQAEKNPKKLYNAYAALLLAKDYKDDPKAKALNEQMLTLMYDRAAAYDTNGQLGNAYIWYEYLGKVNPEYKDLFAKTQDLTDRIRDRVIKKIAIMDFSSPATKPDAGRMVTDSLLAYFTSGSVKNVKILARDVLGAVLKEIEMGQAGLFDIETAKKAGRLKGTDAFIFGSVLQYNCETSSQEGQKMANVVVGKKSVANPAYQMWLMLPKDRPKEEDGKVAAPPPPAPPATINEEIRETVKYKVGTSKKRAVVSVSFRLIDVEEGENVTTQTINKVVEASDDFSEGVSMANIPYKAMNLPSDSELLDKATQEVVVGLGKAVIAQFENPKALYLNSAESLIKKRAYEKAIEKYVDAMFFEEIRGGSGSLAQDMRKDIIEVLLLMGR
jgi:tetratricopeptide (TPR) repeat protein